MNDLSISYLNKVDEQFLSQCAAIEATGFSDKHYKVRPVWEDTGQPAHAKKLFGIVNRYDLSKEFPIQTIRKINWRNAIKEILWIWQKKSNNINDLGSHIWDQWADENGSIGKAYGYQMGRKFNYGDDMPIMDQTDYVLYCLKHNPQSRRIVTSMYSLEDLSEMNLYPCAYSCTFDVSDGRLNMILNQRSQDMFVANSWNVVQYSALLLILAVCNGLKPGVLTHVIGSAHIYDRHFDIINDMIKLSLNIDKENRYKSCPKMSLICHDNFYDYTVDDFILTGYEPQNDIKNIPVAK